MRLPQYYQLQGGMKAMWESTWGTKYGSILKYSQPLYLTAFFCMAARIKFSAICGEVEVAHMHNIFDSSGHTDVEIGCGVKFIPTSLCRKLDRTLVSEFKLGKISRLVLFYNWAVRLFFWLAHTESTAISREYAGITRPPSCGNFYLTQPGPSHFVTGLYPRHALARGVRTAQEHPLANETS